MAEMDTAQFEEWNRHLAQLLSEAGCRTVAHLYGPHANGGLSRLFLRGVERIEGFLNYSDMWINVRETVIERNKAPLLVSAYWAGTDDVAHRYSPDPCTDGLAAPWRPEEDHDRPRNCHLRAV